MIFERRATDRSRVALSYGIPLLLIAASFLVFPFVIWRSTFSWHPITQPSCIHDPTIASTINSQNRSDSFPLSEKVAAPRFVLYRMIGNNMPPLQCHGQLLTNTRFALDHEPELEDCKKKWMLNNIVNETERALLVDLLLSRGYSLDDVIIRRVNYSKLISLPKEDWGTTIAAQNEARNEIIRRGIADGARWILAFDGNQFYTKQAWKAIVAAADRHEAAGKKYFKVPMYRLYRAQSPSWLNAKTKFRNLKRFAPYLWESQMAFRNDSTARYIEGMTYGKDNKLELMDRVCGTGRFGENRNETVDTGMCGCHSEVGCDRRIRKFDRKVASLCGYSIRLWYYPCRGVKKARIFVDKAYRASLREQGNQKLMNDIAKEIKSLKGKI